MNSKTALHCFVKLEKKLKNGQLPSPYSLSLCSTNFFPIGLIVFPSLKCCKERRFEEMFSAASAVGLHVGVSKIHGI